MKLVLYDYTPAPNPRRARIFLAEKGIEVENVQVDLRAGAQLAPEYRAVNPRCTVPALRLSDGTVLTDNAGIAAYLEAIQPEPPLLGATPIEKGLVAAWNARVEAEGLSAVAEVLRNTSPAFENRAITGPHDTPQIPALAERGATRLRHFLDALDAALEGREFLATARFSVADITALVTIDFARWVKIQPEQRHAHLSRWYTGVAARPSAKA